MLENRKDPMGRIYEGLQNKGNESDEHQGVMMIPGTSSKIREGDIYSVVDTLKKYLPKSNSLQVSSFRDSVRVEYKDYSGSFPLNFFSSPEKVAETIVELQHQIWGSTSHKAMYTNSKVQEYEDSIIKEIAKTIEWVKTKN